VSSAAIVGAAGLPLSSHRYPEVSAHLRHASESGSLLFAEPFSIRDSNIIIPDRPGNGIDWNENAIKRYAS
jgi:mandelate racemase